MSDLELEFEKVSRDSSEEQMLDDKIVLNVGGVRYETYRSTLTSHPNTLLGTMFHPRNQAMLHPTNGNEYFIDRNGYAFHYVMEYYRTGTIVWRPAFEISEDFSSSTPLSSSTPCSSIDSTTSSYTEINNATVPIAAAAAVAIVAISARNNGNDVMLTTMPPNSSTLKKTPSSDSKNSLTSPQQTISSSQSLIQHISLPELEQEFNYFQIPFTSRINLAHKAAGELLDSFAYAIEELLCASIAKLIDRISVTFHRDGSQMECVLIAPQASVAEGSKLKDFSLNGYCIVNHFFEDIKKYLETVFPNIKVKLDFGASYKSLTMSMSSLFTRNTIKEHSKIGKLNG